MQTEEDIAQRDEGEPGQYLVSAPAGGAERAIAQQEPMRSSKLGEELPIFCERCGYSLVGLPMSRCGDCKILHFHCPECGHHQPINTLRPAAQRVLGRLRGLWLAFAVFFKLNFFGWLLFAWVAMGVEWSYRYDFTGQRVTRTVAGAGGQVRVFQQSVYKPRPMDWESLAAFGLFGLAFGLVGRMLLLRWKRGYAVGLVLGTLVVAMVFLGARIRQYDVSSSAGPFNYDMVTLALLAGALVAIGAWIVWPIWMMLVKVFLPKATGDSLLEWQRSLGNPVQKLAQE
jgi:hypothetical protein